MVSASQGFHESTEVLSQATQDQHRALVSLQEELEAVDWYSQRMEAAGDPELAAILEHNRDEEIEHAMMVLEWLRRRNPIFGREMEERLFHDGPIATDDPGHDGEGPGGDGSLGIGSLKGAEPA